MGAKILPDAVEGSEKRLPRWMVAVAAVVTVALGIYSKGAAAAGFALGAIISILGYRWLEQAVRSALEAAADGAPKRMGITFFLRYPLALGAILLLYETHSLPMVAVATGLLVPLAGAVLESLFVLGTWVRRP